MFRDVARVEQHADAHEEEQSEDVAQRTDVAERLMTELRFAQHDAGDEGADREGEPEFVCDRADADAGGDDRDEEHLARAPADHLTKHGRQQTRPDDHRGEQEGRSHRNRPSQPGHRLVGVPDLRQDDQKRHNGQVLEDQHADHHATGQRAHRPFGRQSLEDDHRARHRDHGAEPDGIGAREIECGVDDQQPPKTAVKTI